MFEKTFVVDFIGRPDHIEGREEALLLGPGVQWGIVPSKREEGSEHMVVIPHQGHKIHITANKKKLTVREEKMTFYIYSRYRRSKEAAMIEENK